MNKKIIALGLLCIGIQAGFAASGEKAIFVAPHGRDDNPGTRARPYATLARAQKAARQLKSQGPVTVYVRDGIYTLREPFVLGPEDSGTRTHPVVYRAYPNEKPVLRGALPVTGFQPWKGQILQANLQGTPLDKIVFRQLFCDGERMEMARYPNVDKTDPHFGQWAYVLASDPAPAENRSAADVFARARDHFTATPDVIKKTWADVQEAEICIHPAFGWAWNIIPIKAVDDEKDIIYLARPTSYGIMIGDRYFVRNLLAELDAPGEWKLDPRTHTLYFWPPHPLKKDSVVLAPVTKTLIAFEKAEDIFVRGFVLEACEGDAVTMNHSRRCVIAQSTIRHCGGWAVRITEGCRECGAIGNDIYATGAGGVAINAGDRQKLERGDCFADNNYIHHIAVFRRTYNTGVNLFGVGNRARHNLIHDCYHQALLVGGNDQLVEYNIVHHTNLGSEDTGGLYMSSRDYTQRGTIIRYNIFHHCGGFGKENSWAPVRQGRVKFVYPSFTWGIYLDAPETGVTVKGNILYDVPVCGLFNHEGRDNAWENNIIVNAPGFQLSSGNFPDLDQLSYSYIKKLREQGGYEIFRQHYPELDSYTEETATHHTCSPGRFVHNILYYTKNPGKYNAARRAQWQGQMAYLIRAPKANLAGFVFDYNCVFAPPDVPVKISLTMPPEKPAVLSWEEWQKTGQDAHSLYADPLFVNPAKHDFRLKPDSPALRLGFQPIPIEKIGPYPSELRASWPIREAPGAAALGDFTTERYFELPGEAGKPRAPAVFRAPRRRNIVVDGRLDEWPLDNPQAVMECRENFTGEPALALFSVACAAYDEQALYIAVRNPLRHPDKIVWTGPWGQRDGVEIAFQDAKSRTPGPIWNLYGYPDSSFESVTTAGASPAQAERLRRGTLFAARRTEQGWDCEWKILWAAADIKPRRGKRLRFNIGIRKMEQEAWVVWRGTGGNNYNVAKAGHLILD